MCNKTIMSSIRVYQRVCFPLKARFPLVSGLFMSRYVRKISAIVSLMITSKC